MRKSSRGILRALACLSLALGVAGTAKAELQRSTLTYKTVGDVEILADVYQPEGSGKRPVIAWFHGGALIMGNRQGVPRQLRDLSEKEGYVLVSFDYRLAPETKLPQIIEDLKDGLKWIRNDGPKLFGADPSRLVVAGASAGGYLTMMSGIAVDPPPTALVAYWGFGDVDGKWTTTPNEHLRKKIPPVSKEDAWAGVGKGVITGADKTNGRARAKFFIYLKQNGLWPKVVGGFEPRTERDKFTPFCPVRNLSPKYPPILMLHGTADTDVPYEKSVGMARELKRQGVPHELITIEKGGHSLWGGDPKLIQQAFDRSMEFIREHLSKP